MSICYYSEIMNSNNANYYLIKAMGLLDNAVKFGIFASNF